MTGPPVATFLRRVALLTSLTDAELAALARLSQNRQYLPGTQILSGSDESTDVLFILSGRVQVQRYSKNGREVIYSIIGAGEVFGEFSAIDGLPRSALVIAIENTLVCRMSSIAFVSLLSSHFDVALRLMRLLTARLRALSDRQLELIASNSRDRVIGEIARLAKSGVEHGDSITICPAPTHYEIAARIGSQRETVTKELNRLEALGYLRIHRRQIVITDANKFREKLLAVRCP
jgi:CRP/FNR family cyclic AMP-dependent transcriptional regulator